ncbi:tudor domain-containing protein 7B [Aricia agestis]|uniref:tudor domain-containing protein 7B n=1 Tax=Aricia agestis TaxID=91739 RepID=UPI001C20780E|nr:tudor domain-containing protein 7B [Aricia agestis]
MSEKEQVIQALRATLISVKGALTLKQCNRDYRELQGEYIPYKKLGYTTLDKLFHDVPGFKISQVNGEWVVDAIASQETQHIASMVARQKTSKKASAKLSYANNFSKKQGSWRKPTTQYQTNNYVDQYSKKFYRPNNSLSPYNNNNYNKFNKFNKYNEYKGTSYTKPRPLLETNDQNVTKTVSQPTNEREPTNVSDEIQHSTKPEKFTEVKPSGKISASQRLSNLRDRLNTVDLIPLQLPVHHEVKESQPVVTPQTVKLEPPPDLLSSTAKLEWMCQKLGLPEPVYKVHDFLPKQGSKTYDCSVKVGNEYTARTYPNSSPTEDLAKELAALKILDVIMEKASLHLETLRTSSSEDALAGLVSLVSDHSAGVWAFDVPRLYTEKYNEKLPNDWEKLVEKCPNILKERVVNDQLVLLPNTQQTTNLLSERNRQEITIESDLPPLQFPDHDFWNVFITVANSTLEIWLRIIGTEYSDAFEVLLADMDAHYKNSGTCVDKSMILINAWYAVKLEEGGWQRAKILEIDDRKATVFLGDHGDDDVVPLNNIKILEPQFRKLPAQAILCRLEGAEELAASAAGAALVRRRLPGEVLVAAPGPRHDPADPSVALVLYDTSTHRDLNLNHEIVHDFCMAGAFTITQKASEVEVGCVTEEGRVWVCRAGGAATVRAALALLTAGPYRRPLPAAPKAPPPNQRTLYIVRTIDGDWVRCTIISGLDGEGTVRTQLVDSGLILRAPLSSLVPLQSFSPALNTYPHQALQVRLAGAEAAAAAMVGRLRELLVGARVLCRAVGAPPPAPAAPQVELFVRTGPQNMLASVNNDITLQHEQLTQGKSKEAEKDSDGFSDAVEALHKKKERIFRSTSAPDERPAGALPPPPLPAPGQSFDVFVAMAANPWNFVVQPNSTRHTFHAMMATLQVECPKIPESEAPASPASGELYTAYYKNDSSWYRVVIAGVVSTEMVSVYFCDFGDLTVLSARALRPVPAAAPLARSLPPQAIKARLHNAWPLHQDWTVEDCLRFQELCVEQQFVGVCREVSRDPLNPHEPLLTLDLIDTSTDDDIYLNSQLVAERRARPDPPN